MKLPEMDMDQQNRKLRRCQATCLEDLPDHVIQHIQSFLPRKQAICSSLVCKSWLRAWSTFPALEFRPDRIESATDFVKSVDKTLERYRRENLVVEKLNLSFNSSKLNLSNKFSKDQKDEEVFPLDDYHLLLNKWLHIAALTGLKELTLALPEQPLFNQLKLSYQETPRLFSLNLYNLANANAAAANNNIVFHSLRSLELKHVHFDQQEIHRLLSSSNFPVVEKISILFCKGFERIKVDSLGCLVEFKLVTYPNVMVDVVDCPRLESFEYMILESVGMDPWVFNIDSSSSSSCSDHLIRIRSLSLNNVGIDCVLFNKILSKLPCLEKLSVKWSSLMEKIDVSSTSLQELSLIDCGLREVNLQYVPKLRLLDCKDRDIPCLILARGYPMAEKMKNNLKVKLYVRWWDLPDTFFFFKLMQYFIISQKVDVEAELCVGDDGPSMPEIDFDTLRGMALDFAFVKRIGQLSLIIEWVPANCTSAILDAFFTICRPRTVQLIRRSGGGGGDHGGCHKEIINLFANQLLISKGDENPSSCCKANWQMHKCWGRCLDEVEMRILLHKEDDENEWEWLPFPWTPADHRLNLENAQRILFKLKWLQP